MKVLDLFCGAGGLSSGFSDMGFEIVGVDNSKDAATAFHENDIGEFRNADLSTESISGEYDIILGGPPCKPWSSVNTTKRGGDHDDYTLIERFFEHVQKNSPRAFLLENVPPLKGDKILEQEIKRLEEAGKMGLTGDYSIDYQVIQYSDYGAATARNRLIVFGCREGEASEFFRNLEEEKEDASTVKDKIWHLRNEDENPEINHVWPNLTTIEKYKDYYEEEKFGWYILDWKNPAPSFGNVTKTYILHPSGFDRDPPRVISVREAALIMGFDEDFVFPEELGLSNRYQLIVDSVSPEFSQSAARALKSTIQ